MRDDEDEELPKLICGAIVFVVVNLLIGMLIAHWVLWR